MYYIIIIAQRVNSISPALMKYPLYFVYTAQKRQTLINRICRSFLRSQCRSEQTQECLMRKQGSSNVTLSEESVTLMTSYWLLYRGNGFQLINSVPYFFNSFRLSRRFLWYHFSDRRAIVPSSVSFFSAASISAASFSSFLLTITTISLT